MRKLFPLLLLLPLEGCVFSHYKAPLDIDVSVTQLGAKTGTSKVRSILWGLFSWGDASSATAARNGGISVLNHMDSEVMIILAGIYAEGTTIVYGD